MTAVWPSLLGRRISRLVAEQGAAVFLCYSESDAVCNPEEGFGQTAQISFLSPTSPFRTRFYELCRKKPYRKLASRGNGPGPFVVSKVGGSIPGPTPPSDLRPVVWLKDQGHVARRGLRSGRRDEGVQCLESAGMWERCGPHSRIYVRVRNTTRVSVLPPVSAVS